MAADQETRRDPETQDPEPLGEPRPSSDRLTPQEWIDAHYGGPRGSLRKTLDAILAEALALGQDVTVETHDDYATLKRARTFAIARPSKGGRVDLAVAVPTEETTDRFGPALDFGKSRVTHVVSLTSPGDFDLEVQEWLRKAYDEDGAPRKPPEKEPGAPLEKQKATKRRTKRAHRRK